MKKNKSNYYVYMITVILLFSLLIIFLPIKKAIIVQADSYQTYTIKFFGMQENELIQNYVYRPNDPYGITLSNMFYMATEQANKMNNGGSIGFPNTSFYKNKFFVKWSIPYESDMQVESDLNIYGVWQEPNENVQLKIYDKDKNLTNILSVKNGIEFGTLNISVPKIYLFQFVGFKTFNSTNANEGSFSIYDNTKIITDLEIMPSYEYIGCEVKIYSNNEIIKTLYKERGESLLSEDMPADPVKQGYLFSKWKRVDFNDSTDHVLNENVYSEITTNNINIQAEFIGVQVPTNSNFESFYIKYLQPIFIVIACLFSALIGGWFLKKLIFK